MENGEYDLVPVAFVSGLRRQAESLTNELTEVREKWAADRGKQEAVENERDECKRSLAEIATTSTAMRLEAAEKELETERMRLEAAEYKLADVVANLDAKHEAELDKLAGHVARLRAALEPFAECANAFVGKCLQFSDDKVVTVSMGQCRKALAVLAAPDALSHPDPVVAE